MHFATFVLSTGRCGTQWLTQALVGAAGERMRVEHEPLHNHYLPRKMLGASDPSALGERHARIVLKHVESIEQTLETRDYVETGHPCWSSLPWLARRFAGRVRIVHLVRHPVPTACSWVSHGAFVPPLLPHMPAKEFIAPSDPGAAFPEYHETWAALDPFEKSLLYWAEVNAFGLKLEQEAGVPWLRVRYEDIFSGASDEFPRLVRFLGLPPGVVQEIDRGEQVDRHRFALAGLPEVERIGRHPQIVALADKLGYRVEAFSRDAMRARFLVTEPLK